MGGKYDGLAAFDKVGLGDIFEYWNRAINLGVAPLPWRAPPTLRTGVELESLLILTAPYRLYNLENCGQFSRIMIRDGQLKLVFESGVEEVIIEIYARITAPSFHTAKEQKFFIWGREVTVDREGAEAPSNVVPFKRQP